MDFLTGSSTLDAIANKYSRGLSEHYDLIHPGTISSIAEEKLRILAEIEAAENAVVILNAYIYRRYKYHRDNRPRKILVCLNQSLVVQRFLSQTTQNYAKCLKLLYLV